MTSLRLQATASGKTLADKDGQQGPKVSPVSPVSPSPARRSGLVAGHRHHAAATVLRIIFQFTRDGEEVHLSGLAVAREEEKEGSLGFLQDIW